MTYLLRSRIDHNIVTAETPGWGIGQPHDPEEARRILEIVDAWRDGSRVLVCDELPKRLIPHKSRKAWPDAFMSTNQMLVVRKPVRNIIDRLDPDLHQFFPIELETRGGREIKGPWFMLVVMADQDSVVVAKSRVFINPNFPDTLCSAHTTKSGELFVDPSRQSGVHLWREKRFKGHLWGSDQIVAEMEAHDLKFFRSHLKAINV